MINLEIEPAKMTKTELKNWLEECSKEISMAYDNDDIAYANELDNMYGVVKQFVKDCEKNESFRNYVKYSMLSESVTEDTGNEVELIEVDENLESLKDGLKDVDIELNAGAMFDDELKMTSFDPVIIDIGFDLEYMEEKQHIVLTYTPERIPRDFDIDSIPKKDYKASQADDGTLVTFKSISNLADELDGLKFKETVEWPFEMDFKSVVIQRKFEKNASIVAKLIALLGKEQLITKVSGYQSAYISDSNKDTRAKHKDDELRAAIRAKGPSRSRSEILYDALKSIPGVNNIMKFDVPGNGHYYSRLRVLFNGGYVDVFNGGLDFMVSDSTSRFGNKTEFLTDTEDPESSLTDTRNKMLTDVKKRIAIIQRGLGDERKRTGTMHVSPTREREINTRYDDFVRRATDISNGDSDEPVRDIIDEYDYLLDNERYLDDSQMEVLATLGRKLKI